jgi:hypothetical protein
MNMVDKNTGLPTQSPTEVEPLTAMDLEFARLYDGTSSLPGDMVDIDLIDRNLSRGLIREKDDGVPSVVIWAMIAAVAMACLWVGLAWADPVGWAVDISI